MRPLSEDLRRRIIEARQAGAGSVEVSERFRVSRRSVARLFGQYERSGELRPKKIGGYRRSRLQRHSKTLSRWLEKQADITLVELCERCRKELGVTIGINALWHQLRKLGLSFKKNDARRRAEPT
jgi:transposase